MLDQICGSAQHIFQLNSDTTLSCSKSGDGARRSVIQKTHSCSKLDVEDGLRDFNTALVVPKFICAPLKPEFVALWI